jgi:hypothetical protein
LPVYRDGGEFAVVPFPPNGRAQFYYILSHQIGTVKNGISFGKFVVERDGLALCR